MAKHQHTSFPAPTPEQVAAARVALRLTIEELAKDAKVSPTTVGHYERRLTDPSSSTIGQLRSALEARGVRFIGTTGVEWPDPHKEQINGDSTQ